MILGEWPARCPECGGTLIAFVDPATGDGWIGCLHDTDPDPCAFHRPAEEWVH